MKTMNIGILGTGMVGRAHAAKLLELGHTVTMGTPDTDALLAETKPDQMGNPPFSEWHKQHSGVTVGTFTEAAQHGELIINALKGEVAVEVLKTLAEDLSGKVLIDLANPLDFSKGMPPSLFVCNTDSLGEQIQKALPNTKVVKVFNTLNAQLQVNPKLLAGGDHTLFVCGNDADAKASVMELGTSYDWKDIVDLGDITNARGMEMLLPLWLRLWGAFKDPMFQFKVVRQVRD
jgi:predicted dinucleotide-binding enzyme